MLFTLRPFCPGRKGHDVQWPAPVGFMHDTRKDVGNRKPNTPTFTSMNRQYAARVVKKEKKSHCLRAVIYL
jgi:hypothetical protein